MSDTDPTPQEKGFCTWVPASTLGLQRILQMILGFPGSSVVKNPPAHTGDTGSIPGLARSPGGSPLQYSCLENPMDRGS